MAIKSLEEIEARHARRGPIPSNVRQSQTPAFLTQPDNRHPDDEGDDLDDDFVDGRAAPSGDDGDLDPDLDHGRGNPNPDDSDGDDGDDGDVVARMRNLENQLRSMQSRVAPSQRQAEEYRRRAEEVERQLRAKEDAHAAEMESLRQRLEEMESQTPVEDMLSPEEREMFSPEQLTAMAKIADGIAKRRVPKIDVRAETERLLLERETRQVEAYRNEVILDPSRGLNKLPDLTNDPAFQAWLAKEENEDFNLVMSSLLTATSTKDIDKLVSRASRRLNMFFEETNTPRRKATQAGRGQDARSASIARAARRSAPGRDSADVEDTMREIKALSRSRNPDDLKRAKDLMNQLEKR